MSDPYRCETPEAAYARGVEEGRRQAFEEFLDNIREAVNVPDENGTVLRRVPFTNAHAAQTRSAREWR